MTKTIMSHLKLNNYLNTAVRKERSSFTADMAKKIVP